ncbi:protein FAR1-RELATED SEQUENCE 5 [Lathyrus oleraceus]|uniref:protein FAR1-RELATED SEQUENCE 5 n=1 Tax=Pisum sativum TaxID=3888 RepID=UPI0021CE7B11|nr:protein FAR1-RELATED SEQUENCE 5-like [Pisum sativum]
MKEAVYDTFTTASFEQKWCSFIEKFDLQENDWLGGLYTECHRLAPTLLRKYFWAGMSTTQHSESIHAFFDGYNNSTTSLNQFVKQYDNALRIQEEKEFEADFNSMDTTIPCGSNSSIEKQFQSEFTNAKFKEIQEEFISKMNCSASLNSMEDCFATYHVLEEILVGDIRKERALKVVLNKENHDFKCECSLFEFRGIVCRHVLSVCSQERIISLPEKYVLTRWKKNIKRKHSYIKTSYGVTELKPQMDKFDKLCKHFYEAAEVAAESEETTEDLHETLHLFSSNMFGYKVIQVEYSGGMLQDCKLNFVLIQIVNGAFQTLKQWKLQFQTWLIHFTKLVNGSLTLLDAVPDYKTREIAVSDLVNTFHEVG